MVERGGRLECPVATNIPSPGGWVLPTSRLGATGENPDDQNRTAVAQLWGSADPGTQRLLRAAGVPPPDPEEHDLDPRTALSRVTSVYKMATAELRTLVEKKGKLQAKADRAKAEFEKAVQDLASVSQAIEKQTESVAQAQEEVCRKVADQEQPRIQDLTGVLRTELTEAQQSAVLAKMAAANAATTAAQVPEIPAFDV